MPKQQKSRQSATSSGARKTARTLTAKEQAAREQQNKQAVIGTGVALPNKRPSKQVRYLSRAAKQAAYQAGQK